jgi:hypothetical protein
MARVEQIETKDGARGETMPVDPTIDQVRELLFGHTQRANEKRDQELNQTIDALRREMLEKFAAMEARMDEMAHETARRHASTVDAIGSAIADLGAHVRKLAESSGGK